MGARPAVLVIAGTDSSGGAGLARDLQTLVHFEVDAVCAVTAVTAQSDSLVYGVQHVSSEIVRTQIIAALASRTPASHTPTSHTPDPHTPGSYTPDPRTPDSHTPNSRGAAPARDAGASDVAAIKIGMLGNRAAVLAVAEILVGRVAVPIVLDPVLVSSSGSVLLDAAGLEAMRCELFPHVTLLTPNLPEAAALLDETPARDDSAIVEQALRLLALGPRAVLLKGGHGDGAESIDYLAIAGQPVLKLAAPRLKGTIRGTGCALSSAIAAGLARNSPLTEACKAAKQYVGTLIRCAR